jgi:alpha-galactosidase
MYLFSFMDRRKGKVYPDFPTGNGKIDLVVHYQGQVYGIELKSYTDEFSYRQALKQAARYGQQLQLEEITLVFFVEYIDETNRNKYEVVYQDQDTHVLVTPVFVATGA